MPFRKDLPEGGRATKPSGLPPSGTSKSIYISRLGNGTVDSGAPPPGWLNFSKNQLFDLRPDLVHSWCQGSGMKRDIGNSKNQLFFYWPISWRILRRIFFIKWPKRFTDVNLSIFRSNGRYYWIFLIWTSKKKVLRSRWKWYQSPGRHQEWGKSALRLFFWFF